MSKPVADLRDGVKAATKTTTKIKDIVDAVLYLAGAGQVTSEVIHVDGGSTLAVGTADISISFRAVGRDGRGA